MSVIIANGDRLECRMYCQDSEQVSVNTVYYRAGLPTGGNVTDQNVADVLSAIAASHLTILITNNATYLGTTVRVANKLPLPVAAESNIDAGVGTAGAIGLPRQTAGLLRFFTALAGPGGRGRLYIPFPAQGENESRGVPTAAYSTSVEALGTDLMGLTSVNGAGGASIPVTLVVWSRVHARMADVTDTRGSSKWATQKKRGSFGRPNA
jgi:hypothetical protein